MRISVLSLCLISVMWATLSGPKLQYSARHASAPVTAVLDTTVGTQTGSSLTQQEAQQMLDFHNKVRREVGVGPMQWSPEVARYAQEWADRLAKSCSMKHRPRSGKYAQQYGENIFMGSRGYTVLDAAKEWYAEKKVFKLKNWWKAGHYSQMVWRTSTTLGCGAARCRDGSIIVVGNYSPAGNEIGKPAY